MMTEAKKRANKKYIKEKTDDIRLRVHKGTKDFFRSEADKRNTSLTRFVTYCVDKEINQFSRLLKYIMEYHNSNNQDKEKLGVIHYIIDYDMNLCYKKNLIEMFITSLDNIGLFKDTDEVMKSWQAFVSHEREAELNKIIEEEQLDETGTRRLIENAFQVGKLEISLSKISALMLSRSSSRNDFMIQSEIIEKLEVFFNQFTGVGMSYDDKL